MQPSNLPRIAMLITSGITGQKIKLVIAACLWNNPQVRRGNIEICPLVR